ncbi:MAG TPA: hypothetical protein VFF36_12330 [Planctomycetota bacterium]|nr:hypothetical protein [Planctomycetota bacterium]
MRAPEAGRRPTRLLLGAGAIAAALALALAWGVLRSGPDPAETPRSPGAPADEAVAGLDPVAGGALEARSPRAGPDADADAPRAPLAAPEPIAPAGEPEPPVERRPANACGLSLRVVDASGGAPLASFEIERAVWQRGRMEAPSRTWISDPDGRVEYDGVMCESLVGVRVFAPGRPARLFGPLVAQENPSPLELVVGRAAVLRIAVEDGGRLIEGAVVSVDRPICEGAILCEHAVWPPVPTDELGVAEITGLVAGHYVVSATGATRSSDLLELDVQAGGICERLLVLRDELAPGSLVVTVTDNDGPVPHRRVRLGAGARALRPEHEEDDGRMGMTGDDGRCRFEALPPDIYPVMVMDFPDAHAVVRQRHETPLVIRLVD